jgi:hypothetical protein
MRSLNAKHARTERAGERISSRSDRCRTNRLDECTIAGRTGAGNRAAWRRVGCIFVDVFGSEFKFRVIVGNFYAISPRFLVIIVNWSELCADSKERERAKSEARNSTDCDPMPSMDSPCKKVRVAGRTAGNDLPQLAGTRHASGRTEHGLWLLLFLPFAQRI